MATANILSAQSLAATIARSIPQSTSPQLKNPYDAIALASHAAMIAVGFRLIGLTEDDRLTPSTSSDTRSLPDNWNSQSPANFSFRYAHSQSSMEFLLKINRLGGKAVIMGMGIGDDKTKSFDVKVDEYTSASSFPASPTSAIESSATSDQATDTAASTEPTKETKQKIIDLFISQGRLSDFGALTRLQLIQKLLPSLHKEGYEETRTDTTSQGDGSSGSGTRRPPPPSNPHNPDPARPNPLHDDPLRLPPRRPLVPPGEFAPPDFEDEHGILRPPRPMGGGIGGGGYGQRDLYPQGLGPNDPFRGMGPGFGGGGGGMHPTFDDPLFQGQGDVGYGGQGGYDPSAPPGARYDPVGPGGAPRGAGGRGGGGFGGMGGPPNPFGGFGRGDFI